MSLTGDFAKLARTRQELSTFGHRVTPRIAEEAGDAALDQYAGGLAAGRDPWGTVWPARRDGGRGTLGGPGGPLGTVETSFTRALLRIRPDRLWALHQVGANNMEQRATLPFGPSKWDAPIEARIDAVVRGAFTTDD